MSYLLVVAHGSRRHASNAEVIELVSQLNALPNPFQRIDYAFLELAEPSIKDALHRQIADGAKRIVVTPYFLAAGLHVAVDIPQKVDLLRQQHPQIDIRLTDHLGAAPALKPLLLALASQAL